MGQLNGTVLIGVDGGGSGCRAALADADGTVLATATGGPANVTTDAEQAAASVAAVIDAAAVALAGPDLSGAVAHFGLAGVLTAADAARIAQRFAFARCTVTDDRAISVAGALGDRDGALLALGTGTIIAAKRGDRIRVAGGWGLKLSDQASGGWLGRGLLERVLLCHDGIEDHSDLTRAALAKFGDDPGRIVRFAANARPADFAALAPQVIAAAAGRDAAGLALMRAGADYLARALTAVGMRDGDALCLTGGVGSHYAGYLPERVCASQIEPQGTALDGAIRLARAALLQGRTVQ